MTEFRHSRAWFSSWLRSRERTFNIYAKTDDIHANGLHDDLKYLKFGYGRATDDAANEIWHGRMTREQGIEMVMRFDPCAPLTTWTFSSPRAGMTEAELLAVWSSRCATVRSGKKRLPDSWQVKDHVGNHVNDPGVDQARLPQVGTWQPFEPTPAEVSIKRQEDGRQSDYVLL